MNVRFFLRFSILAFTVLPLVSVRLPAALAHAVPDTGISLHIPTALPVVSGWPEPLHISVVNHSPFPLCFYPANVPAGYVFTLTTTARGPAGPVLPTRYGRHAIGSQWLPFSTPATATPLVGPGRSRAFTGFPLARLYDLTLPGHYRLQFTKQQPLYVIGGRTTIWRESGPFSIKKASIGKHLCWPLPGGNLTETKIVHLDQSVVTSNIISITVSAPYGKLPEAATAPVAAPLLPSAPPHRPAAIEELTLKPQHQRRALPVLLIACLRPGAGSLHLRLTGNPLVDFARIEVTGPSFPGEYTVVQKPKPHHIPFITKAPAPLAAYGRWLLKHPVRGLKRKAYTLKPGLVYKYTEPINLTCMYDMSLSGVYRVRVELAHTRTWSPWAKITVPSR